MKIVGLTGGIGSGKTTVANMFREIGVPVYIADEEAKRLMNTSKVIKRKLVDLFGEKAYEDGELNRAYLASKIFMDKSYLKKMNDIVHPKVAIHFDCWVKEQGAPYVVKEAAIIFENNYQDQYDYIITVVADQELKIKRLLERDHTSKDSILAIMKNQLSDAEKTQLSDFVITNHDLPDTEKQLQAIHQKLLELTTKS